MVSTPKKAVSWVDDGSNAEYATENTERVSPIPIPFSVPSSLQLIHSLLILAIPILMFQFGLTKTEQITNILGKSVLGLVFVQLTYCLGIGALGDSTVSSGQNKKTTGIAKGLRKKSKRKEKIELLPILFVLLPSALSSVPIYFLLILFGAPFISLFPHTALLALHISLMSLTPLFFVYKFNPLAWYHIITFRLNFIDHPTWAKALGTWIGAWLGVMPIPLDWDRDWQQWPITVLVGAYLGCSVATIIQIVAQKVRHLAKNKAE